MKLLFYPLLFVLLSTVPVFGIAITSPSNGEHVTSPFTLTASSATCSSKPVTNIGYSLDSAGTTVFRGKAYLDTKVSASVGTHTVHVKVWNGRGSTCVTDVKIDVSSASDNVAANSSVVPKGAVSVGNLESMGNWNASHDSATNGRASGKMSMVGSPSHSGTSRKFVTTYSHYGAERYSVTFGDNRTAQNFMWDAWVYLASSANNINNLEMDLNQTMPNGQTVIFGMQCNSSAGKWDYTENLGSARNPKGHWAHSGANCNFHNWSKSKWHHVQMEYSRTNTGKVTYKYVWLDGARSTINKTTFAARSLGWGSSLSINFQMDGSSGKGTATMYLDSLTLYRW